MGIARDNQDDEGRKWQSGSREHIGLKKNKNLNYLIPQKVISEILQTTW